MFVDVHQQQIDNAKKTDKTDKAKPALRKLDNKRLSARTAQQGGVDQERTPSSTGQQNDSNGVSAVLSQKITELRAVPATIKNVQRTTSPISKVVAPARPATKTPLSAATPKAAPPPPVVKQPVPVMYQAAPPDFRGPSIPHHSSRQVSQPGQAARQKDENDLDLVEETSEFGGSSVAYSGGATPRRPISKRSSTGNSSTNTGKCQTS